MAERRESNDQVALDEKRHRRVPGPRLMTHPDKLRVGDHSHSDQSQRARQRHRHAGSNDLARSPADADAVSPGALRIVDEASRERNRKRRTCYSRYEGTRSSKLTSSWRTFSPQAQVLGRNKRVASAADDRVVIIYYVLTIASSSWPSTRPVQQAQAEAKRRASRRKYGVPCKRRFSKNINLQSSPPP